MISTRNTQRKGARDPRRAWLFFLSPLSPKGASHGVNISLRPEIISQNKTQYSDQFGETRYTLLSHSFI